MKTDSSPVSLTGHFTGQVWCEHGYSPELMGSSLGKILYHLHRPLGWLNNQLFGNNLETMLLQRHQLIDQLVFKAIEEQGITQIIEIASGLSSRSIRTLARYADEDIHYIEADLPQMCRWKNERLVDYRLNDSRLKVAPVNILRSAGNYSPEHLFASLDSTRPTLVITEGLVNYFPLTTIEDFWKRLADMLDVFPVATYISDIWPNLAAYEVQKTYKLGIQAIQMFTRQKVPLHYNSEDEINEGLRHCGFQEVTVYNPDNLSDEFDIPAMRGDSLFRVAQANR
ncbi:MAG: class I SAM-dependent methyltransferase [Hahellaceae bacterium]|nr:class I SAM-dependent methyltransferase [Hahellaceae bacterium]MCP5209764.1 class I SAM-dependent methyltransferase [Hahellaceae bacterium]